MNFLSKLSGSDSQEAGAQAGQQGSGMGLGGLFSSLKEASKDLVEVYKRDLGEFAAVVKKDTNEAVKKTAGSIEKSVSDVIKAEKGAGIDDSKSKMSKLEAMQADEKSYTFDPVPASSYTAFVAELVIGDRAEEIAQILQSSPHVSAFHNDLVPERVEYKDFWSRYFFRANVIKTEEQRKKAILQASELFNEDDDFNWDEEEGADEENAAAPAPAAPAPAAPSPVPVVDSGGSKPEPAIAAVAQKQAPAEKEVEIGSVQKSAENVVDSGTLEAPGPEPEAPTKEVARPASQAESPEKPNSQPPKVVETVPEPVHEPTPAETEPNVDPTVPEPPAAAPPPESPKPIKSPQKAQDTPAEPAPEAQSQEEPKAAAAKEETKLKEDPKPAPAPAQDDDWDDWE